jgi:hypothetical protein
MSRRYFLLCVRDNDICVVHRAAMATVDNKHDIHKSEPTNKLVDTLWRPQLAEILRFFYCSTSALGVSALFTVVIQGIANS